MLTLNILIAVFALFATIISVIKFSKEEITKSEKIKNGLVVGVGSFIMIFSVWNAILQFLNDKKNNSEKAYLHTDIGNIQTTLNNKITKDSIFEIYLKDTFGIERQNNKPIIFNTRIYNLKAQQPKTVPQPKTEGMPDSINYSVKLKNDTLTISPKIGVWVSPFFSFDAKNEKINDRILQVDGTVYSAIRYPHEITVVNSKKYYTNTVNMTLTRSKERPLVLDISADKNQYIIFGDEVFPNKRYIYDHGKVNWIPLR